MALATSDVEQVKSIFAEMLKEHSGGVPSRLIQGDIDHKFELLERIVRVEEELKYLREDMQQFREDMNKRFEEMQQQMDKRFEGIDKRFEDMYRYMDKRFEDMQQHTDKRFNVVYWVLGLLSTLNFGILLKLFLP